MPLNRHDKEKLEALVDYNTLTAVLTALTEIAAEKGDHLRSNWQDATTARRWESASRKIDALNSKISALQL